MLRPAAKRYMKNITNKIEGMHCASCVVRLEKALGDVPGVAHAEVNLATEEARVTYDETKASPAELAQAVAREGYTLVLADAAPVVQTAKHAQIPWVALVIVCITLFMMGWNAGGYVEDVVHHLMPLFALYMLIVPGRPYLVGVWRFVRSGRADMDALVGIGTSVAFIYSFVLSAFTDLLAPYIDISAVYYDVTIVVIGLVALGRFLEARAKEKTGDALRSLAQLQAKTALVDRNGSVEEVALEEVHKDDILHIRPGMLIPVDGVVVSGESSIDEALLTGESLPVEKCLGAKVHAGTKNLQGAFTFCATGVGKETLLARIMTLVADAQGSKAPIQRLVDKVASVFVPIVLGISLLTFTVWIIMGNIPMAILSAVTVLVIACPCALGLATPTAIIVGVGRAARRGVFIKNAEVLERMHRVSVLVIDKTGTLTEGKPRVTHHAFTKHVQDGDVQILWSVLASIENLSEHPLAHALVAYAREQGGAVGVVEQFKNIPGVGVEGVVDGVRYRVGRSIKGDKDAGTTVVLSVENDDLLSCTLEDTIKPEAVRAVTHLHQRGIRVIMATGDGQGAAMRIARAAGISDVHARMLPEAKRDLIVAFQKEGHVVAMVGDGVNDAPALVAADVSLAMSTGSDVSLEASDVTLLHGDLAKISESFALSRITMRVIRQNLFWAFAYNVAGIPLATGLFLSLGWSISPMFAGGAMALSSISVVLNALRLRIIPLK